MRSKKYFSLTYRIKTCQLYYRSHVIITHRRNVGDKIIFVQRPFWIFIYFKTSCSLSYDLTTTEYIGCINLNMLADSATKRLQTVTCPWRHCRYINVHRQVSCFRWGQNKNTHVFWRLANRASGGLEDLDWELEEKAIWPQDTMELEPILRSVKKIKKMHVAMFEVKIYRKHYMLSVEFIQNVLSSIWKSLKLL